MRNRLGVALAAPLIALLFATAGPASAAPEQRVESQAERGEHRAKPGQSVQRFDRSDRQRKMSHANRHQKAGLADQKNRTAPRADRSDRRDRMQSRDRKHQNIRDQAHSQDGRKIRGQNRSPNAWRNMYKRPGQAERMRRGNSGKHGMHRHGWSDRHGQPGNWRGQNNRASGEDFRMKGTRGTLAERFQPNHRAWQHRSHDRQGAYR